MGDLSAHDRNEMLRAFAGLLTAKVADDPSATNAQLKFIVQEQVAASNGDAAILVARMAKQVEAGAVVAHTVLRMLSSRFGLTEAELQQALAEAISSEDLVQD
ncbi:hypothetical protein HDC37_003346 [Microbacterium sp. AK009]|uniref:hypothetical protein n=1 Tax=Microbacterium sp. AK009 TaxID=2723068 RepID=UPI0015CC76BA|nr:hypothetical protein [Microbacterium sp. AK009]NYF18482.1 hypothetical protein [Microbacterium sp. AK009]